MPKVVIGVGSNSDHKNNIKQALDNLQQVFGKLLVSPVYKSAPRPSQINGKVSSANEIDYYFNLVVSVESALSAEKIKYCLHAIEKKQLRERNTGVVTIDLDLLLYGSWVGQLDGNNIPHEDIELCEFVLRPLADLLPNDKHPVKGDCYQNLWGSFRPRLALTPIAID
jgi:2-amino-4-hydroxy-6-hydroxymethyldihydropteridine diphosphokinase